MIYKSFFYECLVNLYFKKKYFLGAFQVQIYLFNNRYIQLVAKTTQFDLYNLYKNEFYIIFSINFKILFIKLNKENLHLQSI